MKRLVEYSVHSLTNLESLPLKTRKRIVTKVAFFCDQKNIHVYAKPLTGPLKGWYRFRVGDYRVIFTLDQSKKIDLVTIVTVAHRKNSYE